MTNTNKAESAKMLILLGLKTKLIFEACLRGPRLKGIWRPLPETKIAREKRSETMRQKEQLDVTIARPVGFTIEGTALVEAIKAGTVNPSEVSRGASSSTRERSIRLCQGIV